MVRGPLFYQADIAQQAEPRASNPVTSVHPRRAKRADRRTSAIEYARMESAASPRRVSAPNTSSCLPMANASIT